ncbi:MAG: D-alanyl-D-alanine carboxypeptidase family protein [Thermincola sp.]|jgi:D-alanyl-D-alanine carboxypeptidase (penicillin-binding protein 5/6)|nr:D-alanyl-D-alanine carboxypeptidase family protein [Thermincola sp.]MDT3704190.1 D-alanyl-D-alanine carboxypeptidase family protein [Thermincola sp.]
MQIRKLILILSIVIYMITGFISPARAEPNVVGRAAVLIDSKSGKILYTKNANEQLPPASTTKILTALIALENCNLTDIVTAGTEATLVEPSAIGLKEGEKISVENHLWGLLLKSANDSAVALAEHISGSGSAFAELMNSRARALGATNSNFVNPNGLPDPNHYSTAHDLALIARRAMVIPEFRNIVSTKVKTIPRDDDDAIKWLQNHNKLLWQYDGAIGIKTGYTREAKQCLVASAEKDGQELIAVVLGSEGNNIWSDAKTLLDYGFNNYVTFKQKDANVLVQSLEVAKGAEQVSLVTEKEFFHTSPKGDPVNLSEKAVINPDIVAPVHKGQVLGKLMFVLENEDIGFVNLVAANDVEEKAFPITSEVKSVNLYLVAGVLLGIFLVFNIRRRRRRRRKRRLWMNRVIR